MVKIDIPACESDQQEDAQLTQDSIISRVINNFNISDQKNTIYLENFKKESYDLTKI